MKVSRVSYKERQNEQNLKQFKNKVDVGWRKFWQRRGRQMPPYVSMTILGHFELK